MAQPNMAQAIAMLGLMNNLDNNLGMDKKDLLAKMQATRKNVVSTSTCSAELPILKHVKELGISHKGECMLKH